MIISEPGARPVSLCPRRVLSDPRSPTVARVPLQPPGPRGAWKPLCLTAALPRVCDASRHSWGRPAASAPAALPRAGRPPRTALRGGLLGPTS